MIKYVLYYRVSTGKQAKSGLGLDAQKRDTDLYLSNYSGQPYEVIEVFTDVISGKNSDKPALSEAIRLACDSGAVLLVSKLDRLSRDVGQIDKLIKNKKLDFKVACMPNADKFQLQLYAVLAEQERDFISERTKAALKEAKARGVKLGGLRDKTNERNKVIQQQAKDRATRLITIVEPLRQQGLSLQRIADELNKLDYKTARGGKFTAMQVKRTVERYKSQV
ncbi:recombinase family protein [Litorilituus sediminis]|uniref:Recombinase family protein n=1 Tax=Litorilituus sediminis TaxID=718192 RepID=A0A4P6P1J5_9GAMM|nr:recombinase family protein [Litorilituus sediminis]QBG34378.1 recombinase family protein [Litorilituus sediminis]